MIHTPPFTFWFPITKKRCFTVHLNLLMSVSLLNVLFLLTCSEPLSYRKKSGYFRQEGSETTHHRQHLVFSVHGGRGCGWVSLSLSLSLSLSDLTIMNILSSIGGALAGSLAIMSDAAHLLTDFASFGISLVAMHLTSKRRTKKLSFGWYRAGW